MLILYFDCHYDIRKVGMAYSVISRNAVTCNRCPMKTGFMPYKQAFYISVYGI